MKIAKFFVSIVAAAQLSLAHAGAIDAAKSEVNATFTQMGVAVTAPFKSISGQIQFDPANPAAGSAQIAINTASFDLGDPEYNKEVQKKDWFNSPQFPQATFASSSIKALGGDKLQIQGKLTIKGKVQEVVVPATFKQNGKALTFEGQLPIKRLAFNIGEGEWKATDMVLDEVVVKFKVVTSN